jgi:hypothetical protein
MDNEHSKLFSWYYKHQLLYLHFVVQQPLFRAAREFKICYDECMRPERAENKFNREWRERLQKEMLRFNGKAVIGPDGNEIISDITSDVRSSQKNIQGGGRPKSALKGQASTA